MAVQTFEEIIASAQLSADERKIFDNAIAKMPALKEGYMRQDDYSRKTQDLAAERKKHETAIEEAEKWKAWSDTAVPVYDKLKAAGIVDDEGNELWTNQKTELEKQLDEAKTAAVGGDMDPAELTKRVTEIVKAAGGLTADEMKAVIASEGKKLAEETFKEQWTAKETDFNTKTIPFVGGFSAANSIVAMHWEQASGEKWTAEKQKEFYEMMSAEKNYDPFALEEKLLAPIKSKKAEEERIEAEVQKRLKAKGMPEGGDEAYIPQDGPKGALQIALDKSAVDGDFESIIKAQSVKAAQELRQEGKG